MIKLFTHQVNALNQTEDFNKVAYYLDMGLGKTFVGSEKMINLGNDTNLLVCQKSKISDWIEHFETYYGGKIYNLTDKKQLQAFKLEYIKGHNDVFTPAFGNMRIIGIINYELAWRRKELLTLNDFTLMLDESSLIQNEKAKQSKFILSLKPKNVILLSGTPTSGKYENLWTQLTLLGWKISKELYNKQYVNWKKVDFGGFTQKIVDKDDPYKNVDRLKSKLREHGAVFMKTEECFELPEQTFITLKIDTSKEYEKFQKDCYITINTISNCEFKDDSDFYGVDVTPRIELVGDTTLTKRLYLRQLCGQYNKDKLQAFKDLASSTHDRLIVFYNYNAELDALKRIAEELQKPISEVNGKTKDLENYENEDNSITLIQYQAGAKGLNLQKANKIIYFTPTDKCEDWMQSKKRIHRIGQKQTCFYYLLTCSNSVEENIYKALQMGVDYTDELFKAFEKYASIPNLATNEK